MNALPPIRILELPVVERIAAGEVIERPASVVKELVENSLDAGATRVVIAVRGAGLRSIEVSDDGHGIPADQVELTGRRHATSKIATLDDLAAIRTLGFRGEALASIASVAEMALTTATGDDGPAVAVVGLGGALRDRRLVARRRGTTVTVRRLFAAVPARLKFLQGAAAESQGISQIVRRLALAHPTVRFALTFDGRASLTTSGGGDREALAAIYGDTAARVAITLGPLAVAGGQLYGLLTGRALTRPGRGDVTFVVNGRWVSDPTLAAAAEEGYRALLPRGRHPIALVRLDLPSSSIDVNVHPAKAEVRLRRLEEVRAALIAQIRAALGSRPDQPASAATSLGELAPLFGGQLPGPQTPRGQGWSGLWADGGRDLLVAEPGATYRVAGGNLPPLRPLAQVRDSLLIAEGDDGVYLIDQHRAHERVLFEELVGHHDRASQGLIDPVVLELKPHQAARLAGRLGALAELGLICEWYGGRSFLIRGVPAVDGVVTIAAGLNDVLGAAAGEDDWQTSLLAAIACRAAVRRGQVLSVAESCALLDRLAQTASPATCPHGAPIVVRLDDAYIARQFDWR